MPTEGIWPSFYSLDATLTLSNERIRKNFVLLPRHKAKHLLDQRAFLDTCRKRHFLSQGEFTFQ